MPHDVATTVVVGVVVVGIIVEVVIIGIRTGAEEAKSESSPVMKSATEIAATETTEIAATETIAGYDAATGCEGVGG